MDRTFTFHFDDKKNAAPKIWAGIMKVFEQEHYSCAVNHMLLSYELKGERFLTEDIEMVESNNKNLLHEIHKSIFEYDDPESATMDYMEEVLHTDGMKAFLFKKKQDNSYITLGMCLLLVEKKSACLCGFGIVPEYQGNGYALKALKLICNYLSDIPGMEHINVEVNGLNKKGLSLYTKFGFERREAYSEFEYTGE